VLTEGDVGVRGVDMILRLRPDIFAAEASQSRPMSRPADQQAREHSISWY
jgi:hypothetical protein